MGWLGGKIKCRRGVEIGKEKGGVGGLCRVLQREREEAGEMSNRREGAVV